MVKSPVYIFGGGDRENNVTGDTHLVLEMKLKTRNPLYTLMAAVDAAMFLEIQTSN